MKRAGRQAANLRHWAFRLVLAVIVLVVLWELFTVAVGITTTHMWFESVHDGSVYTTMIEARVLLFVVFAVIAGLIGGLTLVAVQRIRPRLELSSDLDTFRWSFRRYEARLAKPLVLLAVVVPGILLGRQATSGWQTYLLWRHATPFHQTDPQFGKDISFYLEIYPFHSMVAGLLQEAVLYGLWIALIGGYWYGLWRLRRNNRKTVRGMTVLVSLLLGVYLALRAYGYWLSRYALTTSSRGPVTGSSYTDVHAGLPSRYTLVVIAALCALVLLANVVVVRRVRVIAGALVVVLVGGALAGAAWPAAYFHFEEAPSASKVDLGEISRNIHATRDAFGLSNQIDNLDYDSASKLSASALTQLATKTSQIAINDPNQVSPSFTVLKQLQAYYGFKSTLDVGHYPIDGLTRDVVIAARELQLSGIPGKSWVNQHLVYTHGYGMVAAPTDEVDPTTESPAFLRTGSSASDQIRVTRPQIYFGQAFSPSSFAIVGQPAGSKRKLEFDHPAGAGSSKSDFTTYSAHGGVPIGSTWRRLLWAVNKHSSNILFSNEINSASQLLTVRNPRARVAKVAPWLTLDGDTYPAVVNGHVKWIVDGYTTSSNYPNSQLINLHSATNTTLVSNGSSVAQPNSKINYMRNSVKAVVDAYTGKVTLYAWNQAAQPDPLLSAWESVFPGLVKPQSDISSSLLQQMRYPTDLFNVQRTLLARYHVTSPSSFYSGNDFWSVPSDPTYSGSASQPSHYVSMSADGYGSQQYSLSTPMATLNGRELSSYISVDAQPGANYGKMTVLNFPADAAGEAPSQVQNDIESDTDITEALTLQRGGNSQVVLGDLQSVPLAGRILYVEPVYTRSSGNNTFPVLRHVIALYGNGNPSFENTLGAAVRVAIRSGISGGS